MRIIHPIHDRVLLKRIAEKEVTEGGIIIPQTAKEKAHIAVVVAVGPGHMVDGVRVKPLVKKGDVVAFGKYSGQDFDFDGETYLFVLEQEILGVFEE